MPQYISTNVGAMASRRQIDLQGAKMAKFQGQLSSGSKVADPTADPTAAALGSVLDTTISALTQASSNVGQANTMIQLAAGTMSSTNAILTRLSVLAEQAVNGTLSDNNRKLLQKEVDALTNQIDVNAKLLWGKDLSLLQGNSRLNGLTATTNFAGTATLNGVGFATGSASAANVTGIGTTGDPYIVSMTISGVTLNAKVTTADMINNGKITLTDADLVNNKPATNTFTLDLKTTGVSLPATATAFTTEIQNLLGLGNTTTAVGGTVSAMTYPVTGTTATTNLTNVVGTTGTFTPGTSVSTTTLPSVVVNGTTGFDIGVTINSILYSVTNFNSFANNGSITLTSTSGPTSTITLNLGATASSIATFNAGTATAFQTELRALLGTAGTPAAVGGAITNTSATTNFTSTVGFAGTMTTGNVTALTVVDNTANAGNFDISMTIGGKVMTLANVAPSKFIPGGTLTLAGPGTERITLNLNLNAQAPVSANGLQNELRQLFHFDNLVQVPANLVKKDTIVNFQIGQAAADTLTVSFKDITAAALKVNKLDFTTAPNASKGLDAISAAQDIVNTAIATLGGQKSQLEFANSNLTVSIQNQSAAKATITDTDVADALTNSQIAKALKQMAVAMFQQQLEDPQTAARMVESVAR